MSDQKTAETPKDLVVGKEVKELDENTSKKIDENTSKKIDENTSKKIDENTLKKIDENTLKKIDEETLKKMMSPKRYPRCGDRLPCGIRQFWYLIELLVGLTVQLTMVWPLYLLISVFIAPCHYMCGCYRAGCCGKARLQKSREYYPTQYRSKCCCPYTTIYFASCRLRLLQAPTEKRGCCWSIQNHIAGFYQVFEFVVNAATGLDAVASYWTLLANHFGDKFPLLYGVGIADSETVKSNLHSNDSKKSKNIFSMPVAYSAQVFAPLAPIYLDTNSDSHLKVRKIIFAWLSEGYRQIHENYNYTLNELRRIVPRNSLGTDNDIRASLSKAIFYLTTGGELTNEEVNICVDYMTHGAAFNVLSTWEHFLFGFIMERQIHNQLEGIRQAFLRVIQTSPTLRNIAFTAQKEGIDVDEALRLCVHTFLVGGLAGLEQLSIHAIRFLKEDPVKRLQLWEKNPHRFMKETARLTSPIAVTIVSSKSLKYNIGGYDIECPIGTPLINMLTMTHRDPEIFGGPEKSIAYANSFDPDRLNLDLIMSWNGLEKYVAAQDTNKAPRYCPGHDMAFFLSEFVINRHKPFSLDHLTSKNLSAEDEKLMDDYEEKFNAMAVKKYKEVPLHTKVSLLGAKSFLELWDSLEAKDVLVPTEPPQRLETVECGGFELPVEDEDLKNKLKDYLNFASGKFLSLDLFEVEDVEIQMENVMEGHELRENIFGELWPTPNVHWKEFSSDEAQSLIVFYGPGLMYTRRYKPDEEESKNIPEHTYWICDVSYLSIFEVRKSFEIFGHTAYFNKDREIIGIYWCHNNKYVPRYDPKEEDPERKKEWEHVKFGWRCTLGVSLTIYDHLLSSHWMVSSAFDRATRETLPVDHPMRRFNKMFTFRTTYVNHSAKGYLINKNGVVHRALAFPYDELTKIIHYAHNAFQFECLPDKWKKSGVEELSDKECPAYHDSMAFWKVMKEFFVDYVKLYYGGNTDEFMKDPFVIKFRRNFYSIVGIAPRVYEESFENFANVYTQILVEVTGIHEYVGNLIEFKDRPDGYCGKIRQDHNSMADLQAYMQMLILGALTGARVPALLGNYTHLLLRDQHYDDAFRLFEKWQNDLLKLAEEIKEKNMTRIQPFNAFSPTFLESSVSI